MYGTDPSYKIPDDLTILDVMDLNGILKKEETKKIW